MRPSYILLFALAITACESKKSDSPTQLSTPPQEATQTPEKAPLAEIKNSVVRINSTQQTWNPGQPWEKNPPTSSRALAAIVGPQLVLISAELVADSTYLEFESVDGSHFAQAKVISVDYEANLALLGPLKEEEGDALLKKRLL
ncbi:MAG: hypothetical protein HC845_07650 [Akkermansiaceae bacterium]|nr:hypothetical protein [Akkermansiaceae bacterium]